MTLTESPAARAELSHAISAIQSEWSPRERTRRLRLARMRQHRLARMLSPQPRLEAYDCKCDVADAFEADEGGNGRDECRSHRYVLIEG